jgi:hypothetical protein
VLVSMTVMVPSRSLLTKASGPLGLCAQAAIKSKKESFTPRRKGKSAKTQRGLAILLCALAARLGAFA